MEEKGRHCVLVVRVSDAIRITDREERRNVICVG
jgi:hypothetical protein